MDLKQQIIDTAGSPKSYTSDGQSVTAHSIKDVIDADRYIKSNEVARSKRPLRIAKFNPGGPV